jgi:dTDP-4-amino-4,6-dideoxygalactose transaminase
VTQQQKAIASIVAGSPLVTDVAGSLGWDGHSELLRYPVLTENREQRNRLLSRLRTAHIEATSFYGTTVNRATDVPETDLIGDVRHAESFADRLLTLPAHSGVTMRDIAQIAGCLQSR